MQNFVVFMESPSKEHDIGSKAANMCLNRFCIDEDVSFESAGVFYLKKSSNTVTDRIRKIILGKTIKGKVKKRDLVTVTF